MYSSINLFFFISLVLFCNPKYMRLLLLSSSSETKLFELHSLPHGCLTFLGDSQLQHKKISLTKMGMQANAPRSAGVVLYSHPKLVLDPHTRKVPSFSTMFAFSIENIHEDENGYGDGLAFLISPDNNLLGSPGYLGLVDSTDVTKNKFIAIEFDTRCDSIFHDPDDNHVGLDINSLLSVKLVPSSSLHVDLKNGDLITSWIDFNNNEKRLEVYLSDSGLKPKKPQLKVDIDLSDYLKENMFVGFSSATERSMHLTRIHQWEFTIMEFSSAPPPSPPESTRTFPNPSGDRHSHLNKFITVLTIGVCSVPFIVFFSRFCWKKLMGMIQRIEGANNVEMQTVRSSGGISCRDFQLSVLADEVAKGLKIEKVLGNRVELIHVKTMKSSIAHCNSLPAVKPSIVPPCNSLPLRTNDITLV